MLYHRPVAYVDPPGELGALSGKCCRSCFGALPRQVSVYSVDRVAVGNGIFLVMNLFNINKTQPKQKGKKKKIK